MTTTLPPDAAARRTQTYEVTVEWAGEPLSADDLAGLLAPALLQRRARLARVQVPPHLRAGLPVVLAGDSIACPACGSESIEAWDLVEDVRRLLDVEHYDDGTVQAVFAGVAEYGDSYDSLYRCGSCQADLDLGDLDVAWA
jgi:hypothetical protein